MPSGMTKAKSNRRNMRRAMSVNRPQPTTPIAIVGASVAGSVATLTFNQPVTLKGVPKYTTDVAGPTTPTAISAALTTPLTVAVTFNGPVATATEVYVPYEDPAVRNASGGFVATSIAKIA